MREIIFILLLIWSFTPQSFAQFSTVEGYVFDIKDNQALKDVEIKIFNKKGKELITSMLTDERGFFSTGIPARKTYTIESAKYQYNLEKTKLVIKRKDKNKKVLINIKMTQISDAIVNKAKQETKPTNLVDKPSQELPPNITENVSYYGIDTKRIDGQANPEGVTLDQEFNNKNPYAEVTNATRLVDENYYDNKDREAFKRQRIPTAYSPKVTIDPYRPKVAPNKDIPSSYNRPISNPRISPPAPQFGETMVASAATSPRTRRIPTSFIGYKVEFVTATQELPANHDIFRKHGNIFMEQKQNGIYSYLLGSFSDQPSALSFLKEVILPAYPNANLVYFENGKRGSIVSNKVRTTTKPASAPPR